MDKDVAITLLICALVALMALASIVSAVSSLLDRWLSHQERMARILAGLDAKAARRKA